MKVTYYLEIVSSWCHWAEPTWTELKRRYAGRAEFDWRIARMGAADFPASREQCDWFFRRSGGTVMHAPYMLNSGWVEPGRGEYTAPDLVAEAARDLGSWGDTVRLALAHAALRDGRRVGSLDESVAIGARASSIPADRLKARAESAEVRARIEASTAEFLSHRIDQRPAFILTDDIGDKAVFSGLVRIEPLAATLDAMLADTAAYAAHAAHHGGPPAK